MVEFQVEGMSCGHCVGAVTKAIHAVDSKAEVNIDLATHKVKVDSQMNTDALSAAISEAGYDVAGVTTH